MGSSERELCVVISMLGVRFPACFLGEGTEKAVLLVLGTLLYHGRHIITYFYEIFLGFSLLFSF